MQLPTSGAWAAHQATETLLLPDFLQSTFQPVCRGRWCIQLRNCDGAAGISDGNVRSTVGKVRSIWLAGWLVDPKFGWKGKLVTWKQIFSSFGGRRLVGRPTWWREEWKQGIWDVVTLPATLFFPWIVLLVGWVAPSVWSPCVTVCLFDSSFGGERSLVHQGGEFGMVWYGARWMVASSSAARGIGISPGPVAARILGLSSFVWQLSWKRVARQSIRGSRVSSCTISGALPAAHHYRERRFAVEEFLEVYKCALWISLLSPSSPHVHRMFTDCFWISTPTKMCAKVNEMGAKKNVPVIGWRRTYIR